MLRDIARNTTKAGPSLNIPPLVNRVSRPSMAPEATRPMPPPSDLLPRLPHPPAHHGAQQSRESSIQSEQPPQPTMFTQPRVQQQRAQSVQRHPAQHSFQSLQSRPSVEQTVQRQNQKHVLDTNTGSPETEERSTARLNHVLANSMYPQPFAYVPAGMAPHNPQPNAYSSMPPHNRQPNAHRSMAPKNPAPSAYNSMASNNTQRFTYGNTFARVVSERGENSEEV